MLMFTTTSLRPGGTEDLPTFTLLYGWDLGFSVRISYLIYLVIFSLCSEMTKEPTGKHEDNWCWKLDSISSLDNKEDCGFKGLVYATPGKESNSIKYHLPLKASSTRNCFIKWSMASWIQVSYYMVLKKRAEGECLGL